MKKAVAERASCRGRIIILSQVIPCIELILTPPAKLELALGAFHEFAASGTDDAHLAPWADLSAEKFVKITE